jgi:hypothetical protein
LPGYEKPIRRKEEEYRSYKVKNIGSGWKRTRNQRVPSCLSIANKETGRRIRIQSEEGWRLTARPIKRPEEEFASNQRRAGA